MGEGRIFPNQDAQEGHLSLWSGVPPGSSCGEGYLSLRWQRWGLAPPSKPEASRRCQVSRNHCPAQLFSHRSGFLWRREESCKCSVKGLMRLEGVAESKVGGLSPEP